MATDFNGDRLPDIIVGKKKGPFLFTQGRRDQVERPGRN